MKIYENSPRLTSILFRFSRCCTSNLNHPNRRFQYIHIGTPSRYPLPCTVGTSSAFIFKTADTYLSFFDLHCDLFKKKKQKNLTNRTVPFRYGPAVASLKNEHKIQTLIFYIPPAPIIVYTHSSGCQLVDASCN